MNCLIKKLEYKFYKICNINAVEEIRKLLISMKNCMRINMLNTKLFKD